MRRRLTLAVLVITVGIFSSVLSFNAANAQSIKKRKHRRFGSSLSNLKWDPKLRRAIDTALAIKAGTKEGGQSDDAINLKTSLAVFDILVTDQQNRSINGLNKGDFLVYEDGVKQQIDFFAVGDDINRARSIVLIIDYSGSLLPYLSESVAAAKVLIGKLGPKDEMAIVTDDVELVCDFTGDKKKLGHSLDTLIDQVKQGSVGRSRQFTALMATLQDLIDESEGRSIVIFQTDGDEISLLRDQEEARDKYMPKKGLLPLANFGFADLVNKAEHAPTTIYTVIPGGQLIQIEPEKRRANGLAMLKLHYQSINNINQDAALVVPTDKESIDKFIELQTIQQTAAANVAAATGGWTTFLTRPDKATEIYEKILTDIDHRYTIGCYPSNTARDGKKRRVRIEVRGHPEYTVQGRKFYFAPAGPTS